MLFEFLDAWQDMGLKNRAVLSVATIIPIVAIIYFLSH